MIQTYTIYIFILSCCYLFFLYLLIKNRKINIYEFKNSVKNFNFILIIFLTSFIYQMQTINIEVLDWDVGAFLIVAQDFLRGNLPFESQMENKGPLLFIFYSLPEIFFPSNLIALKIFDNFIFFIVNILIYFNVKKITSDLNRSFFSSIFFILLTSFESRGHPGYTEYFCLIFLGLSIYLIPENKELHKRNLFFVGIFLAISTLTSISSSLIVIGIIFSILIYKQNRFKNLKLLAVGFLVPYIFFLILYSYRGTVTDLILNVFFIPIKYVNESNLLETFSLFKGFLIDYINRPYQELLFVTILLVLIYVIIFCFETLKSENKELKNKFIYFVCIFSSFLTFVLGRGYWHQILYFVFFLCFAFIFIKPKKVINVINLLVSFVLLLTFPITIKTTYKNLNDISLNNYPIYSDSKIISNLVNPNTVLALDNHLLLYYLNKPNQSYFAHPTLIKQEWVLELFKYKLNSNIEYVLSLKPDLIICDYTSNLYCLELVKNKSYKPLLIDSLSNKYIYKNS